MAGSDPCGDRVVQRMPPPPRTSFSAVQLRRAGDSIGETLDGVALCGPDVLDRRIHAVAQRAYLSALTLRM